MKAHSFLIDRDAQKKVLGRVVIDDETGAIKFIELTARGGRLLEAVRKLHDTGDRNVLLQAKTRSYDESVRLLMLQDTLFQRY